MTFESRILSHPHHIKPFLQDCFTASRKEGTSSPEHGIKRIECSIPRFDLLAWLHRQRENVKFYWQDREGKIKIAALGSVCKFLSHESSNFVPMMTKMRSLYQNGNHKLRFYGGVSFHTTPKQDSMWADFGYSQWILPRVEIIETEKLSTLTFHMVQPDDLRAENELEKLDFQIHDSFENIPSLLHRSDTPHKESWKDEIEEALMSFQHNKIDKIVLARKSTFSF